MYQTERLILKHPEFSDWEIMYRNVWSRPETAEHMLWNVTESEEAAKDRMLRSIQYQQEHTAWFLYEAKTMTPIGFCGFCEVQDGVFEDTGIAIGPDYTGIGYGQETLDTLTEILKSEFHARRFIVTCRGENTASRHMILRCGFRFSHAEPRRDPRNGKDYTLEFYYKDFPD